MNSSNQGGVRTAWELVLQGREENFRTAKMLFDENRMNDKKGKMTIRWESPSERERRANEQLWRLEQESKEEL